MISAPFCLIHKTLPLCAIALLVVLLSGCATTPKAGSQVQRQGDEIMAAGQLFHTGTRVVLWLDEGGYDAYRVERRFSPLEEADWRTSRAAVKALSTPNRYGVRRESLRPEELERVRGGGWDLPLLQRSVDQFVIHFDASGTSRQCFKVLHDLRDLSVHFLLDVDGTIYQTLDLKERAWHATTSNSRSIGIEIANIGAYELGKADPLSEWYERAPDGQTVLKFPSWMKETGLRVDPSELHPARPEPVLGRIQNKCLRQYDFTPAQYEALVKLTATLCHIFPGIICDYPRDASGQLLREKMPEDPLRFYHGLLGHYHIQSDKVDPGPAFQWDYVVKNARVLLEKENKGKDALLKGSGLAEPLKRQNDGAGCDEEPNRLGGFTPGRESAAPPR